MPRIAPKSPGKSSAPDLQKRVNVLTVLVVVQILLLGVILLSEFDIIQLSQDKDMTNKYPALENMDVENFQPVVEEPETGDLPPEIPLDRKVRIEVLNGCGVKRIASGYADLLRKEGYDIRGTGNAEHHDFPATLLIDRTNLENQAYRLAKIMGIEGNRVSEIPDPKLVDIDITVIIGKDYKSLKIKP